MPGRPGKDESERNCGFGADGGTAVTATSARVSGLNVDGDYYFRVCAVNPIGDGDWSQAVHALLRPSSSGRAIVSPTSITVDEGTTVTYTMRLSTAPPHPVQLYVQPRGIEGSGTSRMRPSPTQAAC